MLMLLLTLIKTEWHHNGATLPKVRPVLPAARVAPAAAARR
jgi:hypothetical protein